MTYTTYIRTVTDSNLGRTLSTQNSLPSPQPLALQDGSASTDDVGIVSFRWEQLEGGPNRAAFANASLSRANATGLTKGKYNFRLTVEDNLGNEDQDDVAVTVAQDENEAPVADAGKDVEVALPVKSVLLNGSKSHDDFRASSFVQLLKSCGTRKSDYLHN